MRIAIDCRSLRKKPVGVPNFLIAVINHMALHRKDWTIYLLSNEDFHSEVKKKLNISGNVTPVIDPFIVFPGISTLWYFVKLPFIIRKLKIDFFYSPIPNLPLLMPAKVKTLITVHDMVYRLFPQTMSLENKFVNFLIHDRSIRRADKIWAISEYTRAEIERFYPKRRSTDILVGTAVESRLYYTRDLEQEERAEILKKYGIRIPFILTVGTIEPRKNLQFLLSLAPLLEDRNFQIVVVGAKGWGNPQLRPATYQTRFADTIRFLGFVSDEDLIKLYNLAAAYVATSLNEGFCLPLLEAMHCGCPVVAAHNSGMIEVAGDAGETVSGWDINTWVDTIEKTVREREFYAERGFVKIQNYQWDEVITRVNKCLEDNR